MTIKNVAIVFVLVLILGGLASLAYMRHTSIGYPQATLDTFAKCLTAKGITMYGAVWCPHCQKEKAGFGSSFKFITYVECPDNVKLCTDKGVTGYPTWITADGGKYVGEQGLEKLAEISGCPLSK